MALPNVFSDSPLSPLGIGSPIEEVIGRVNWLIADFNERHKEDAAPEFKELAATDSQQLKQAISLVRQQALAQGFGSGLAFTGKDLLDGLEKRACV